MLNIKNHKDNETGEARKMLHEELKVIKYMETAIVSELLVNKFLSKTENK